MRNPIIVVVSAMITTLAMIFVTISIFVTSSLEDQKQEPNREFGLYAIGETVTEFHGVPANTIVIYAGPLPRTLEECNEFVNGQQAILDREAPGAMVFYCEYRNEAPYIENSVDLMNGNGQITNPE